MSNEKSKKVKNKEKVKISKKVNDEHYVDNKAFLQEMIKWKKEIKEAEESGDDRPPVSNFIGECFLKIAERLCSKSNFTKYTYKDEMIGDAIENCLMYAHNFNPRKSKIHFRILHK